MRAPPSEPMVAVPEISYARMLGLSWVIAGNDGS
jgi:hypothetical protein